jgi:hypothetical protein
MKKILIAIMLFTLVSCSLNRIDKNGYIIVNRVEKTTNEKMYKVFINTYSSNGLLVDPKNSAFLITTKKYFPGDTINK